MLTILFILLAIAAYELYANAKFRAAVLTRVESLEAKAKVDASKVVTAVETEVKKVL